MLTHCILFGIWGPHPTVIRVYSRMFVQGSRLAGTEYVGTKDPTWVTQKQNNKLIHLTISPIPNFLLNIYDYDH